MDARDFFGYKHEDEEPGRRPEDEDQADGDRPPQFDEAITLDDQFKVGAAHAGKLDLNDEFFVDDVNIGIWHPVNLTGRSLPEMGRRSLPIKRRVHFTHGVSTHKAYPT